MLSVIVDNYNAYTQVSIIGPFVNYTDLNPNWGSIVLNSPWALISGLFRPFVFEINSLFQLVISIENTLLLLLSVYNMKYLTRIPYSSNRLLIVSALVYIILLAIFLTLSTPNFGTLSRYRIGFLPFLFCLLLYYPSQPFISRILKLK